MESLYEKIGGAATINKLVTAFYQRVLADQDLAHFFEKTTIEKLERMQRAFFSVALGGPEPDQDISLYQAHRGRGIQRSHLTRFTEHLLDTMQEMEIDETDAKKICERISMYSDEVLGEASVDG